MKTVILIGIISLATLTTSFAQTEVSGTITYYFNEYQGDKPDIGAKVFLIDSISYSKIENIQLLENFNRMNIMRYLVSSDQNEIEKIKNNKSYKKLLSSKLKSERKDKHLLEKNKDSYDDIITELEPFENKISKKEESINNYIESLTKNKALTEEEWTEYGEKVTKAFFAFIISPEKNNIQSRTVDANGRYSFNNIENNTYYVLIKSNNRTGINLVEINGKIEVKKLKVKNESIDFSHKFTI